jgi:DNA repair exonuclease SbcCD ATPase subunit
MSDAGRFSAEQRRIAALEIENARLAHENERLSGAIHETLRLADSLAQMAESGAGFSEHWGERVLQAVRPLRDTQVTATDTQRQNEALLGANSENIEEINALKARVEELEAQLATAGQRLLAVSKQYDEAHAGLRTAVEGWTDALAATPPTAPTKEAHMPGLTCSGCYYDDADETVKCTLYSMPTPTTAEVKTLIEEGRAGAKELEKRIRPMTRPPFGAPTTAGEATPDCLSCGATWTYCLMQDARDLNCCGKCNHREEA